MIEVNIVLYPKGNLEGARSLGSIQIANDIFESGTLTQGDYVAKLFTKNGRLWKTAKITGFPRKRLLSHDLLYRVLKEAVGDRND